MYFRYLPNLTKINVDNVREEFFQQLGTYSPNLIELKVEK